ncbi:MAG: undecaprenyl/decaprenyl-phosphate alpha-N-acetylglucosaminyl 1-phosphate transferase [bacterium]|nr:undecaprenyl/decaprenyl-phosphate alpha-N-acetylglucosaminyl 1-phosphate transferase [bacterium]
MKQITLIEGLNYFLIALLISVTIIPLVIYLSKRFNLYDRIDWRKDHEGEISRIGGIAIFLGFLIPFLFVIETKGLKFNLPIYIGAMCLAFITGFIDDLFSIKARYKLVLQIVCGLLIAFSGLEIVSLSEVLLLPSFLSFILTIVWVVIFMNAINLLDGMDGLASGIVLIANIFVFIMSLPLFTGNPIICAMAIIMAGAILGFYIFNFPPAKIFMGDGGAYFLGFMYATMPLIESMKTSVATLFLIPLILLLVPIGDIMQVMLRRMRMGDNIFIADKNHIHHRLMAIGLSIRGIIFVLYVFTTILGLTAILMVHIETKFSYLLFGIIALLLLWSMYLLNSVERILEKKIDESDENTRKFIRLNSNNPMDITTTDMDTPMTRGMSFDLTPMGISFITNTEWPQEQILHISYHIPGESKPVKLKAIVVWSKPIEKSMAFFTGAQVIAIDNENKFITNFYFQMLKDMTADVVDISDTEPVRKIHKRTSAKNKTGKTGKKKN